MTILKPAHFFLSSITALMRRDQQVNAHVTFAGIANTLRRLWILLLIQLCLSCTTVPPPSQQIPYIESSEHQQQLANITRWTLKGKIGFKSLNDTLSATIMWEQQDDSFHIRLSSILGSTLLEMNGRSGFAELHVDDQYYVDSDAERLLQRITGWQLPVNQLSKLVKGQIPQQGFQIESLQQNLPQTVTETVKDQNTHSLWKIGYNNYQLTNHVWMPYDLRLTKAKNLIKIRITSWELY